MMCEQVFRGTSCTRENFCSPNTQVSVFSLGITRLTQMKLNMRHNHRLLIALNTDPYLKSLCVCCSLNPPTCLKQKELTERGAMTRAPVCCCGPKESAIALVDLTVPWPPAFFAFVIGPIESGSQSHQTPLTT